MNNEVYTEDLISYIKKQWMKARFAWFIRMISSLFILSLFLKIKIKDL